MVAVASVLWSLTALAGGAGVERVDLDGDGVLEKVTRSRTDDGMRVTTSVCVGKGEACFSEVHTRYGDWAAWRLEGDGRWFPERPCVPSDPADPRQAVFFDVDPGWAEGPAQTPVRPCLPLDPVLAAKVVGAEVPLEGWVFHPDPVWLEPLADPSGDGQRYTVQSLGPLVVLTDGERNRHRWVGAWDGPVPEHVELTSTTLEVGPVGVPLDVDLDGDGLDDQDWSVPTEEGRRRCVTQGVNGHAACVETREDGAFRVVSASPEGVNTAVDALTAGCAPLDPANPAHQAAWMLSGGEVRSWTPGVPGSQVAGCATVAGWSQRFGEDGEPRPVVSATEGTRFWAVGSALAIDDGTQHLWLVSAPGVVSARLDGLVLRVDRGEAGQDEVDVPRDLDRDGVIDPESREWSGGSGWSDSRRCVVHGASGHKACRAVASTAYARFVGVRHVLEPEVGNRAQALLDPVCPAVVSAKDPAFGSLYALANERPWFAGRPVDQQSGCLPAGQEDRFAGSWVWTDGMEDRTGWSVLYTASWARDGASTRTPVRIGGNARYELYGHAHAVAVYDTQTARHRWLVNLEDRVGGGHKLDRWETVKSAQIEGDSVVVHYLPFGSEAVESLRLPIR
ncbi:MAG: hypothetical protein R3F61_02245 [Myxococcota bacterium]